MPCLLQLSSYDFNVGRLGNDYILSIVTIITLENPSNTAKAPAMMAVYIASTVATHCCQGVAVLAVDL